MAALTEEMLATLVAELFDSTELQRHGATLSFERPFARTDYYALVREHAGVDLARTTDTELREVLRRHNVAPADIAALQGPKLIDEVFKTCVEPRLVRSGLPTARNRGRKLEHETLEGKLGICVRASKLPAHVMREQGRPPIAETPERATFQLRLDDHDPRAVLSEQILVRFLGRHLDHCPVDGILLVASEALTNGTADHHRDAAPRMEMPRETSAGCKHNLAALRPAPELPTAGEDRSRLDPGNTHAGEDKGPTYREQGSLTTDVSAQLLDGEEQREPE